MTGATAAAPDFLGMPVRRLDNGQVWLDFLVEGGPRIVRFGRVGADSIFAVVPGNAIDSPTGPYRVYGGHRVWYTPETAGPFVPDETGLEIEELADSVRLVGFREPGTGLRRTMEIRFAVGEPAVTIAHGFRNEGTSTLELAVWPITQLLVGGVAFVPQPKQQHEHSIVADRVVVLWPYASWEDPRLTLADGLLAFRAQPGHNFKLGCRAPGGTAAYLRAGELFVKRFDAAPDMPHADFGCNLEIYCDPRNIELETLGPVVTLPPGEVASHVERWELHQVGPAGDDAASLFGLVERFRLT